MKNAPHPNLLLHHEEVSRAVWQCPNKSYQIFHLLAIPSWPWVLDFPGSKGSDHISNLINHTLATSETVAIETRDRVYKHLREPRGRKTRTGRHTWFVVEEMLSRGLANLERWEEESVKEDWETGSVKRIVSADEKRRKELEEYGSWFDESVMSGEEGFAGSDIVPRILPHKLQRVQEWLNSLPRPPITPRTNLGSMKDS